LGMGFKDTILVSLLKERWKKALHCLRDHAKRYIVINSWWREH
jgi:hypothetical protein